MKMMFFILWKEKHNFTSLNEINVIFILKIEYPVYPAGQGVRNLQMLESNFKIIDQELLPYMAMNCPAYIKIWVIHIRFIVFCLASLVISRSVFRWPLPFIPVP